MEGTNGGTRGPLAHLYKRMLERKKRELLQWLLYSRGPNNNFHKCNSKADLLISLGKGLIVKLLRVNKSEFYATLLSLKKTGVRTIDMYEKPRTVAMLGIHIATELKDEAAAYSIRSLHDG